MAKRAKVEDLLNAFLKGSNDAIKKFESIGSNLLKIEKVLYEIKRTNLDVNMTPVERLYQQMESESINHIQNLELVNERAEKRLKVILEDQLIKLEKATQKKQNELLNHFTAILVYLLFTTAVLSYGIAEYYKRKEVEKTNQLYLQEVRIKNLFLKESELEVSFEKWLDGMSNE